MDGHDELYDLEQDPGDLDVEPDEGFQVTLSDPTNATIDVATPGGEPVPLAQLAQLDVLLGLAELAQDCRYVRPEISDDAVVPEVGDLHLVTKRSSSFYRVRIVGKDDGEVGLGDGIDGGLERLRQLQLDAARRQRDRGELRPRHVEVVDSPLLGRAPDVGLGSVRVALVDGQGKELAKAKPITKTVTGEGPRTK